MENALSGPHRDTVRKTDCLFAAFPTDPLGAALDADQCLASQLTGEVKKLCLHRDTLTRSCHNQSKHSL